MTSSGTWIESAIATLLRSNSWDEDWLEKGFTVQITRALTSYKQVLPRAGTVTASR